MYQEITEQDFIDMYGTLLERLDPRLILFAQSPAKDLVGFCLAYPDVANVELQQFILKSLAVEPDSGGLGIGSLLVGETHRIAQELNLINGGIHAFMWDGSLSRKISAHAGQPIRQYALFSKRLDIA